MKIFISWSGPFSHGVAVALQDWLPNFFTPLDVFVSSESIRKGKRWPQEIAKELETTNFGIACLTHDNLKAEWLLFETGALSKLPESSVSTLLLGGLAPSDIGTSPLSHFQHTSFEREDFFKLLKTVNDVQGQTKRNETTLRNIFEKFWGDLEAKVKDAGKNQKEATEPPRKVEDMVRELLEITNTIARTMPKLNPSGFIPFSDSYEQWVSSDMAIAHKSWFGLSADLVTKLRAVGVNSATLLTFTPAALIDKGISLKDMVLIQEMISRYVLMPIGESNIPILSRREYQPPRKDKSAPEA